MSATASVRTTDDGGWPVTTKAWDVLAGTITQLREDLVSLAGQGLEEGIVRLPMAQTARRLETLERVRVQARVVDDASCAIGRRATLHDEDGQAMTCELVFPGEGDPSRGLISADSPLGAAIVGKRTGDIVEVDAPVGRWTATVISID
jgi:transcription elongation GreA/GreB family factor